MSKDKTNKGVWEQLDDEYIRPYIPKPIVAANSDKVNTTIEEDYVDFDVFVTVIKEITSAKSVDLGKIIITGVGGSEDSQKFKKLFMNSTNDAVKFFIPDWNEDKTQITKDNIVPLVEKCFKQFNNEK